MNKKPLALRLAAGAMTVMLLAGCSSAEIITSLAANVPAIEKNQTISENSKWINSTIDGSIDADTPTNVKDDFYTAVNKDWLLQPLPEGKEAVTTFDSVQDQFEQNYEATLTFAADDTQGADPAIMSAETLQHIQTLVYTLRDMGADTAARNAAGVEPLRPYLQKIEDISSLDEMADYFCDTDGKNLYFLQLAEIIMDAPVAADAENNYTVYITPAAAFSLVKPERYRDTSGSGSGASLGVREQISGTLGRLGYSEDEIDDILKRCYRFEIKLARCAPSSFAKEDADYLVDNNTIMDRATLEEIAGAYPIGKILDALGLGGSETFTVTEVPQLKEVGRLYTESNLEEMKAYLIVNTILQSVNLLDDDTYNLQQTASGKKLEEATSEEAADEETGSEEPSELEQNLELYSRFVDPYLYDAVQQIYVAHFCTAQQKAEIEEMVARIRAVFRTTLEESDWMSDETRAEALEKLDAMGVHVLYPDHLIDYSALNFDGCNNLLDVVAAINHFKVSQYAGYVNQPVDRSNWNLEFIATTNINAAYNAQDNSINILAGLLSTDEFYGVDKSEEENLARLGVIVGHEITHGFDTTGCEYDKNGRKHDWWTNEDKLAFDNRAQALIRYYSGLTPVGHGAYLNGSSVSGEAIADMGGMQSALKIAETIPDFNYDKFFRSYAEQWRQHSTYTREVIAMSDVHPVTMLRVNVIVSQFEEFQQTYDVQPGDGMYVAAEDRILVW